MASPKEIDRLRTDRVDDDLVPQSNLKDRSSFLQNKENRKPSYVPIRKTTPKNTQGKKRNPKQNQTRNSNDDDEGPRDDTILEEYYLKPKYGNLSVLAGAGTTKFVIESSYLMPYKMVHYYAGFDYANSIKLLMYGPPGCGKTFCVKALAGAISEEGGPEKGDKVGQEFGVGDGLYKYPLMRIFDINSSTIKGKFHGGDDANINRIWNTIAASIKAEKEFNFEKNRPGYERTGAIIFLDEFESVGRSRTLGVNHSITSMLTVLDGVRQFEGLRIVAATNIPWNLDSAILSRFQVHVFVDLPTDRTRQAVAGKFFDKLKMVMWMTQISMTSTNFLYSPTLKEKFVRKVSDMTGVKLEADDTLNVALKKKYNFDNNGKRSHKENGRTGKADAVHLYGYSLRDLNSFLNQFHSNLIIMWEYFLSIQESHHEVTYIENLIMRFPKSCEFVSTFKYVKSDINEPFQMKEDFVEGIHEILLLETSKTQGSSINIDEYVSLVYYSITGQPPPKKEDIKIESIDDNDTMDELNDENDDASTDGEEEEEEGEEEEEEDE